jgi:hypothetical protein
MLETLRSLLAQRQYSVSFYINPQRCIIPTSYIYGDVTAEWQPVDILASDDWPAMRTALQRRLETNLQRLFFKRFDKKDVLKAFGVTSWKALYADYQIWSCTKAQIDDTFNGASFRQGDWVIDEWVQDNSRFLISIRENRIILAQGMLIGDIVETLVQTARSKIERNPSSGLVSPP